ncbi:hypothetical protein JMJ35_010187 [Cladonia borealis]|uniref:Uncharacterized protein n=1 Tax=Cladonia borealis TaxID=184061 RepID=A0AA39V1E1_9LECA|nr:hypothetical protein JMJ35_010187 [Cladonia borealis]
MSSLGRIQNALVSATQDTTLALANVNFDFALLRIEAPREYKDLGAALSTKRRSAAEHGTTHKTARKLGSLFEQRLPSTPSLFRAYGSRASEIANSPVVNPKGGKVHGPFAEHIGVDGTTIWAAATSGRGAVATHLLACMLARMWDASEAVSIWEQIVDQRKKELSVWNESDAIPLQSLATAHLTLTREQLADWDASARAWLRAADEAKKLSQKQLMLIIQNLTIPVNKDMDVYASVMQAWNTAMITMDKLVEGSSQSVQNGAVLLGLSAWHLYPDLIVLGNVTVNTRQKDSLINPSGIVTLGLQGIEPENSRGVYWSLPLAHVRYYGDPVVSEGCVQTSRISVDDLWQITLGSLFALWGQASSILNEAAHLISLMWKHIQEAFVTLNDPDLEEALNTTSWLYYLASAAKRFLQSSGPEHKFCKNLLGLGQRRSNLLGRSNKVVPIFGLTDVSFVRILKPELRVDYLRKIAPECCNENDCLVIVIQHGPPQDPAIRHVKIELATASPRRGQQLQSSDRPKRWICEESNSPKSSRKKGEELREVKGGEEYYRLYEDSFPGQLWDNRRFNWVNPPAIFLDTSLDAKDRIDGEAPESKKKAKRWSLFSRREGKYIPPVAAFELVCGDVLSVALFRRVNLEGVRFQRVFKDGARVKKEITSQDLAVAFSSGMVSPTNFLHYLNKAASEPSLSIRQADPEGKQGSVEHPDSERHNQLKVTEALRAVATTALVYATLPNATMALSIIQQGPLSKAQWVQDCGEKDPESQDSVNLLLPYRLSRPATFACVAMFESGCFDLKPDVLNRVMAVSAGDSIYVAAPVLCDPAVRTKPHEVRRIIGNVGRPGLAFLIPPISPRMRQIDLHTYRVINHNPYNGKLEDCFQNTSLHLSFSGYELVLDVGNQGAKSVEAVFLETIISAHDRGEWIADIDTLSTLSSPHLHHASPALVECTHGQSSESNLPHFPLTSIDRWEELLEMPMGDAVVRAHSNWLARSAAAAISVRMGNKTVLLSSSHCWKCGEPPTQQSLGTSAARISSLGPNVMYIL